MILLFFIDILIQIMGNQNDKVQHGELAVTINHPRLQNAKLSGEGKERLLQVNLGVDEKEQ